MNVEPIGYVRAARLTPEDDNWGGSEAAIELVDSFATDALAGLDQFSHVEVLFVFHAVDAARIVSGARHPRNNPDWPAVGIFAQRGKNRPNRIGSTICRVLGVEGRVLRVAELDALPMREQAAVNYRSTVDGKFHGCGHDGHAVTLLTAAAYLAKHDDIEGNRRSRMPRYGIPDIDARYAQRHRRAPRA